MKLVFHKPYRAAPESELIEIPKHLVRDRNRSYKAKKSALEALINLCHQAERGNVHIVVISSHRTYDFQKNYFENSERKYGAGKGSLWVAPAGYSEHHTGYVFDLADRDRPETDDEPSFETTKASLWLKNHASAFGFEPSFPPGNWQGVSYEPWHWRYVADRESKELFYPPFLKKAMVIVKSLLRALMG